MSTSAKSGYNVNEVFDHLARKIIDKKEAETSGGAATGGRRKKKPDRGMLKVDGI